MSTEMQEVIRLLTQIAQTLERVVPPKKPKNTAKCDDERVALAVVAISRGASTFEEVAKAIGVSRSTASRNPGIQRAMKAAIRDRTPTSREAAEEYQWDR